MGLFDNLTATDMEELAGLFGTMPTFNRRQNPVNPLAGYWSMAGERKKAEERQKAQDAMAKQLHELQLAQGARQQQEWQRDDSQYNAVQSAQSQFGGGWGLMANPQGPTVNGDAFAPGGLFSENLPVDQQGLKNELFNMGVGGNRYAKDAYNMIAPKQMKTPDSLISKGYRYSDPNNPKSPVEKIPGFEENKENQYENIVQDDKGNWWGRNKNTNKIEKIEYSAPDSQMTKLRTVQGTDASGMPITELYNPATGERVTTGIKGMSAENAAKATLVSQGSSDIDKAKEILLDKNGKPNRKAIAQMNMPLTGSGVPFTEGRDAYTYIYNAIEGKLRAESGAAVPETEVQRMANRFAPSVFDSDALIKSKLDRLQEFLKDTEKKMIPGKVDGIYDGLGNNPSPLTDKNSLYKKYGLE